MDLVLFSNQLMFFLEMVFDHYTFKSVSNQIAK
uniref:Uncharacterized protein n=1 Tax=Anguilla anguilla TaxID=7936 RepID=A0A0E9VVC9_ANGAN